MSYANIPQELQVLKQWVLANTDNSPGIVYNNGDTVYGVSPTSKDRSKLLTFEDAVYHGNRLGLRIGFILADTDPFCCIDLDVKNRVNKPNNPELWTTQDELDKLALIVKRFNSYTESSKSGQGVHIFVKAKLNCPGINTKCVEVYDRDRFIIFTGWVLQTHEVVDYQSDIDQLVAYFRPQQLNVSAYEDQDAVESDADVIAKMLAADNSDKTIKLVQGEWYDLGYPSQSEADNALLQIISFFSPNNDQCKRIFKRTALSERDKCTDDYLTRTMYKVRLKQAADSLNDDVVKEMAKGIANEINGIHAKLGTQFAHSDYNVMPDPIPSSDVIVNNLVNPVMDDEHWLKWPSGIMGQIAHNIYDNSHLQVREFAIAAAIAMVAGICGKKFNINRTGINQYINVIALSATGKESLHKGISDLVKQCTKQDDCSHIMNYFEFGTFASGQALVKEVIARGSFLSLNGEWGKQLSRMAKGTDPAMETLKTVMTDIYQKSGEGSIIGGIKYSDKEKNSNGRTNGAYSMLGESTPETYMKALTEEMMEDGFMSRLFIIEYPGDRVDTNRNLFPGWSANLLDTLNALSLFCLEDDTMPFETHNIGRTDAARIRLNYIENFCGSRIKGQSDHAVRQMWNRAALKILKLAALCAVSDNYTNPIVTLENVSWSEILIFKDIENMSRRINAGDVGISEKNRLSKLKEVIREFFTVEHDKATYNAMKQAGVIPKKLITNVLISSPSFAAGKQEPSMLISKAIDSLVADGDLVRCTKQDSIQFGRTGECFRVMPTFLE